MQSFKRPDIYESSDNLTLPQMIFKGLKCLYSHSTDGDVTYGSSILHTIFKKEAFSTQIAYLNLLIYLLHNNISANEIYLLLRTTWKGSIEDHLLSQSSKPLRAAYASFLMIALDKGLDPLILKHLLSKSEIEELKPIRVKLLYLLFSQKKLSPSEAATVSTDLQEGLAHYILALPNREERWQALESATDKTHLLKQYLWRYDLWFLANDDNAGYLKKIKEAHAQGDYQPPSVSVTPSTQHFEEKKEETAVVTQIPFEEIFSTLALPLKNYLDRNYFHMLSHWIGRRMLELESTTDTNRLKEPNTLEVDILEAFLKAGVPIHKVFDALLLQESTEQATLARNLIGARRTISAKRLFSLINQCADDNDTKEKLKKLFHLTDYSKANLSDTVHRTGNWEIIRSYLTLIKHLVRKNITFKPNFMPHINILFGRQALLESPPKKSKPVTSLTTAILGLKDPKQKQDALQAALDPQNFLHQMLKDKGEPFDQLQAEAKNQTEATASNAATASNMSSSSSNSTSSASSSSSSSISIGMMTHATTFSATTGGTDTSKGSTTLHLSTTTASTVSPMTPATQ